MDPWTIILTVIGGALCVYWLGTRNHNYFKTRGIPCLRPIPIFGNILGIILKSKTIVHIIDETYKSSPGARYSGFYEFSIPTIVLKDPELVKSVTIKNFDSFPNHKMFIDTPFEPLFHKNLIALKDDEWKDMRTVLSPAFTSSKMKMMFEIISPCAVNLSEYLTTQNSRPEEFNMKEIFSRYTLDVIASSAFGLSVNSLKDRDNEFYRIGKDVADFSGLKMFKFMFIRTFPGLAKLFKIRFLHPNTSDFFMKTIENTITTRDAQGIVRPDMIHLMMQARNRKEKSVMSLEDMTAQAFVFFLGGFESSSITLSFASHLLALNPDVQRKLQAEIDQILEKTSSEVSYEDLHAMKYLDAVVSETLRMFPPTAFMDRVVKKSFTLPPALPGQKPVQLEVGQYVWIPVYSLHHDPEYFPDPEKFDPDRFIDDSKSEINPLTYIPFGLGPRVCIANRFALMEVKLALFHVLAKCNILPTPKTPSVIKLSTKTIVMSPEGGFQLKIEPRL